MSDVSIRAGLLMPDVATVGPTLRANIYNFHFETFRKGYEGSKREVSFRRLSIKISKKENSFGALKNKGSVTEYEYAFLRSHGSSLWVQPWREYALTPSRLNVQASCSVSSRTWLRTGSPQLTQVFLS